MFPYRGKRALPSVAMLVQERGTRLTAELFDAAENCDEETQLEVQTCISEIASICAELTDMGPDGGEPRASPNMSPKDQTASGSTRFRDGIVVWPPFFLTRSSVTININNNKMSPVL
jgi:hypothetical protein